MDTHQEIKEKINVGLESLLTTLNGDMDKIKNIVSTFIAETPLLFDQIHDYLRLGKRKDTAELVHKVKIRYGYLGLEDTLAVLNQWESDLMSGADVINHAVLINHFKEANEIFTKALKETKFYEPPQNNSVKPLPFSEKLVLIAEDDEINAMVFELFVQETGASVIIARDGLQAMKLATEKNPDLIFMDVHMPFFSGLEAIKKLRSLNIKCPIVSLSASTRLNESQSSIDAGADYFLIKPANRESITYVLLKYLS